MLDEISNIFRIAFVASALCSILGALIAFFIKKPSPLSLTVHWLAALLGFTLFNAIVVFDRHEIRWPLLLVPLFLFASRTLKSDSGGDHRRGWYVAAIACMPVFLLLGVMYYHRYVLAALEYGVPLELVLACPFIAAMMYVCAIQYCLKRSGIKKKNTQAKKKEIE